MTIILKAGARGKQAQEILTRIEKKGLKPVILKRDIRTYETATRNTLDIKQHSHLPV